jgi:plastocyanin
MTFSLRSRGFVRGAAVLAAIALAAAPALAADHAVSIIDKTFDPTDITVSVGDTVTWTVTKSINELHSVTSGKPGESQGAEFDSGIVLKDNGQTFEFTFTKAGTFDYFCQVHPTVMTGVVTVLAAGASPAASEPAASAPAVTAPPATEAPAATGAPGSAAPGASESPAASEAPSMEHSEPVPVENRVIAAGILIVTLIVLFIGAALWRRVNPA